MRTKSHIGLEISQREQARRCWHCPPRMPTLWHLLPLSDSSRRLQGTRDEREECARNINGLLSLKEIQQWVWREGGSQETWKKEEKKNICRLYCQKMGIPFIQWRKENFESHPDRTPESNLHVTFPAFLSGAYIAPWGVTVTSVICSPVLQKCVCFSVTVQFKTFILKAHVLLTIVSALGEPQALSVLPEPRYEHLSLEQCSRLNPLSTAIIVYFSCSPRKILFNWQEGSIPKSLGF